MRTNDNLSTLGFRSVLFACIVSPMATLSNTLITAHWTLSPVGRTLHDAFTYYPPDGTPGEHEADCDCLLEKPRERQSEMPPR